MKVQNYENTEQRCRNVIYIFILLWYDKKCN